VCSVTADIKKTCPLYSSYHGMDGVVVSQMYGLVNSLHAPLSIGAKVNSLNCFDTAQVEAEIFISSRAVR
jgi:hypothetical protein